MVKRSKKPKKKASRRLNPPLPPGITRETIASFKKCSEIYDSGYDDPGDIEKIKLCMFYSRLTERLREQGYSYENGYKISLHNCRESTLPADIRSLPLPDFPRTGPKPPGIWFSDFYEIDSSSGESKVLERPNISKSWIQWCIREEEGWINPNKCTHILIAKMKEVDLSPGENFSDFFLDDVDKTRVLKINSKDSYKEFTETLSKDKGNTISWRILSKIFGGISVPDTSIRGYGSGSYSSWLYGWDVASYIVWNTREGFQDLQTFALSEFQDLVDDYNNLDVDQLEEIANQSESEASSRSSSVTSRDRTVSPRGRTVSPRGRTVSPRKTSRRKVSPSPVRRSSRRKERGRSPTVKSRRGKKK